MTPSVWKIEVEDSGVRIKRMHEDRVCESYGQIPHWKAVIYAAAIVQGIQPPRDLRECDELPH